jgi:hypothetical protein
MLAHAEGWETKTEVHRKQSQQQDHQHPNKPVAFIVRIPMSKQYKND